MADGFTTDINLLLTGVPPATALTGASPLKKSPATTSPFFDPPAVLPDPVTGAVAAAAPGTVPATDPADTAGVDPKVTAAVQEGGKDLIKLRDDFLASQISAQRTEAALGAKMIGLVGKEEQALQPFQPPKQTSPLQMWGSAAMIFAAFGSMFTRQPMTTALNAMAGVMTSYRKGDQQAFDNAMEVWKANSDQAIKLGEFEMRAYEAAMGTVKDQLAIGKEINQEQMNEVLAKVSATAGALGDGVMLQFAQNNYLPDVIQALSDKQKTLTEYAKSTDEATKLFEVEKSMADWRKANPKATPEEELFHRHILENPYSSGPLSPEDIHQRAIWRAAGDIKAAYDGLPFGAPRVPLIKAIDDEALTINPNMARSDPSTEAIMDWPARVAEEKRLRQMAGNMQVKAGEAFLTIGYLKEQVKGINTSKFVPLNVLTDTIKAQTSDPQVLKYYALVQTLVNQYSAAITPSGQARIWDKQHALDIINKYADERGVEAVLDVLKREMNNAITSVDVVEKAVLSGDTRPVATILEEEAKQGGSANGGGTSGSVAGGSVTKNADGSFTWKPGP